MKNKQFNYEVEKIDGQLRIVLSKDLEDIKLKLEADDLAYFNTLVSPDMKFMMYYEALDDSLYEIPIYRIEDGVKNYILELLNKWEKYPRYELLNVSNITNYNNLSNNRILYDKDYCYQVKMMSQNGEPLSFCDLKFETLNKIQILETLKEIIKDVNHINSALDRYEYYELEDLVEIYYNDYSAIEITNIIKRSTNFDNNKEYCGRDENEWYSLTEKEYSKLLLDNAQNILDEYEFLLSRKEITSSDEIDNNLHLIKDFINLFQ